MQPPPQPIPGAPPAPAGATGTPATAGSALGAAGIQGQSRQLISFKDLPPLGQFQAQEQQGLDPSAAITGVQSQLQSTMAQGPSQGPMPNSFDGPMVPPGVQSFPDDMAHLHSLMQQGMGPGSTPQEHELAQNASAIARAHAQQSEANAQNDGQYQAHTAALGGMIHQMGSMGKLPQPADVAAHVAGLQQAQAPTGPGPGGPVAGPPPDATGPYPDPRAIPGVMPPTTTGMPGMLAPPGNQGMMPPPGSADMGAPPQGPPQLGSNVGPPPSAPPGPIDPSVIANLLKKRRGAPGRP